MPLSPRMKAVARTALLFLPIIGYEVGDYLIAHWDVARRLDALVRPYAFDASLLVGLVVGLAQLGWTYWRTRQLSSYVIQQLGFLVAFTVVPLAYGHFVQGWSVFGLIWIAVAAAYGLDACLGASLFKAYPRHFAPQHAAWLDSPHGRAIVRMQEVAFVVTCLGYAAFLLLGNRYLPKAEYVLLFPFVSKGVWVAFTGYCFWFARRRARALARTAPGVVLPA